MEPVTESGETFTFHKGILTAKSFFGATGKEYLTADEAKKANPKGSMICVKNVEHGGATELSLSIKL